MLWDREKTNRYSLPPRYGLVIVWTLTVLGVLAAMRFTALPLAK